METSDSHAAAERHRPALARLRLLLLDVDGILTDGRIIWAGDTLGWNRWFHTGDGYGLKLLQRCGLAVGVISGEDSVSVRQRVARLGIDRVYLGAEDKRAAYRAAQDSAGVGDAETAYMGDELFDVPLLQAAGFAATVPAASWDVKAACDYVTVRPGGHGAVREVVDMIRYVQGLDPAIVPFDAGEG